MAITNGDDTGLLQRVAGLKRKRRAAASASSSSP
jgi:hypothetical protein